MFKSSVENLCQIIEKRGTGIFVPQLLFERKILDIHPVGEKCSDF